MSVQYVFKMRYAQADSTGYYHTRWDKGGEAEVIASTRKEAFKKLWEVLGECDRTGFHWVGKCLSMRDQRILGEEDQ